MLSYILLQQKRIISEIQILLCTDQGRFAREKVH